MKIVDTGTVVASREKTDLASACFPTICVLPSGRWISGFRGGPAKMSRTERGFVSYSDDQGKTWSAPTEPAAPIRIGGKKWDWRTVGVTSLGGERVALAICAVDASEPLKPMFNEATEGLVDMKLYTAISEDGGKTFGTPRPVDCGKYRDVPTPATGPMVVMPDGAWAAQFEVNKHYEEKAPWQHASAIVLSKDEGKTWSEAIDIHTDPNRVLFCWDQRVSVVGDKVISAFWTFDQKQGVYLNIHGKISTDSGRTWGALFDTGIPGQPARVVAVDDKRWVLVHMDRTGTPVVKARLSTDGGKTWPETAGLLVHERKLRSQTWNKNSMQDAWAEMSVYSIGLPDAVRLPDGDVLAVYYTGDHHDYTDVAYTRIRV